jgi:flagellar motor switch protein FliG
MEDFKSNITLWATTDIEIKKLNEKIKEYRQTNKCLTEQILKHIESNEIENNVFKISSIDTAIKLNKTKVQESISYKFLQTTIESYFSENVHKDNKYHMENLLDFIKTNRLTTEKKTLTIIN